MTAPTTGRPQLVLSACPCGHGLLRHDAIATRFCAATIAGRLCRTCICKAAPTKASPTSVSPVEDGAAKAVPAP